jgi:hypothetical protein
LNPKRRKAEYTQYAYRIFHECRADMAQDAGLQVGTPRCGSCAAVVVARDRIDGRVPARRVL